MHVVNQSRPFLANATASDVELARRAKLDIGQIKDTVISIGVDKYQIKQVEQQNSTFLPSQKGKAHTTNFANSLTQPSADPTYYLLRIEKGTKARDYFTNPRGILRHKMEVHKFGAALNTKPDAMAQFDTDRLRTLVAQGAVVTDETSENARISLLSDITVTVIHQKNGRLRLTTDSAEQTRPYIANDEDLNHLKAMVFDFERMEKRGELPMDIINSLLFNEKQYATPFIPHGIRYAPYKHKTSLVEQVISYTLNYSLNVNFMSDDTKGVFLRRVETLKAAGEMYKCCESLQAALEKLRVELLATEPWRTKTSALNAAPPTKANTPGKLSVDNAVATAEKAPTAEVQQGPKDGVSETNKPASKEPPIREKGNFTYTGRAPLAPTKEQQKLINDDEKLHSL